MVSLLLYIQHNSIHMWTVVNSSWELVPKIPMTKHLSHFKVWEKKLTFWPNGSQCNTESKNSYIIFVREKTLPIFPSSFETHLHRFSSLMKYGLQDIKMSFDKVTQLHNAVLFCCVYLVRAHTCTYTAPYSFCILYEFKILNSFQIHVRWARMCCRQCQQNFQSFEYINP